MKGFPYKQVQVQVFPNMKCGINLTYSLARIVERAHIALEQLENGTYNHSQGLSY